MTLRLPREHRDWLRAHAQRERRSLNSELLYRPEVARAAAGEKRAIALTAIALSLPRYAGSRIPPALKDGASSGHPVKSGRVRAEWAGRPSPEGTASMARSLSLRSARA
ncbi:Arc family DNA-binding protein [Streptomyces pilosus]|uniref:Arc-like DNA binding domain-containing protein n=1 Tax=Streptomyces pilosus TaxID=28893 RepID=A0A918C658_9ACTN|nr:Arc family DNA-binding protein [Streptomyces pilosus]GGR08672.1 hypothetical protein GCM10010280_65680 [Streptomyces pilosus]